jgi:nucleoside-diphosphate-sugar epimerase
MKIAIVGLGYVGLPLSLQFARSGVEVLGLDIDPAKVESLNQGRSYIKHIESSAIAEPVKAGSVSGIHGLCPHPGSGGGDHLCADAAEQESRAGHFLHHRDG